MANKKIILVDGTNLAFRMYFALSRAGLTAKDGRPSGAVYGFVKLIIETILNEKPDNVIIAWDPHGGTFRDKKFDFYKANRPTEMPEDLLEQFPQIQRGMDLLGVPQFTIKAIEADDIVGTIATDLRGKKYDVKILSGDKDLFQLVGDNIKALYPSARKGMELLDSKGVKNKLGVLPEQVIDFKAIAGDSSDNIPGIKGIGVKGAANLLEEYGSLEGIYKNIDKIKSASVQKKLQEGFQSAQDSQWLATIKTDVDFKYDLNKPVYDPKLKPLEEFFNEYNFSTIRDIFNKLQKENDSKVVDDLPEEVIETHEILEKEVEVDSKLLKDLPDELAFYLSPNIASEVEIAYKAKRGYASFSLKIDSKEFKDILGSKKTFYTLDYKNTAKKFFEQGLDLPNECYDILLASKLEDVSAKVDLNTLMLDNEISTNTSSSVAILSIANKYEKDLPKETINIWKEIESPLSPVVAKMEMEGIFIDKTKLKAISKELHAETDKLQKAILKELGDKDININSTQQLSQALDEKGFDLGKRNKNGSFSTKKEILENLAVTDETGLIQNILDYRIVTKLSSTFTDAFLKYILDDGRIHGVYNQIGANTGRFSSTEPNLQNIPIRHPKYGPLIRSCIAAPKGKKLIGADYSQIELRVLAHVSKDPTLIEAFEKDQDIHARTASEIYEIPLEKVTDHERRLGKTLNFALVYMQGPFATARQLSISMKEAKEYIAKYFARFPNIQPLIDKTLKQAKKDGFVETIYGRRVYFPNINSKNFVLKAASERAAFNATLQGSGTGDIIKMAMLRLDKKITKENLPMRMIMQIHDELIFEVDAKFADKAVKIINKEMALDQPLKVPLKIDASIGDNWAETK